MASKRFSRLLKILAGAFAENEEIFQLEGRLERFVHFWALVIRQFIRHRCLVRSAALSYSTLLALIPLLVVALSVTSSLLQDKNEQVLTQFVERAIASIAPSASIPTNSLPVESAAATAQTSLSAPNNATNETPVVPADSAVLTTTNPPPAAAINTQKEVAHWIHDLVKKSSNGTLGVFGMIGLVFTAIALLRGIEETFNDIWGVTRGRNWLVQIMLYWTIITLGPMLLSTALAATGSVHLQATRHAFESSPLLAPVVKHLVPVGLLSLTLGLFYKLTPNTKVEFRAAMIGGLCAGASWHLYNQLGFLLVGRALNASKFYGGIFLFVLLMGGLYILWLIILLGAQIAYAYQNRTAYLRDRLAENVNQRGREFVALRIMTCLGQRFKTGLPPATVPAISLELGVPSGLAQSVLRTLAATQLVREVAGGEAAFVPARPLDTINAYDILTAMRTGTGQDLPMAEAPALTAIYGEFARIEQAERTAASSISLLALTDRLALPAGLPEPKKPATPEPPLPPTARPDKNRNCPL